MDIKVVLSLLAILTAAGVALFCDYRRTRDLRRREALVEMRVRKEEEERKNLQSALSVAAEASLLQRPPRQTEGAKFAAPRPEEVAQVDPVEPATPPPALNLKVDSKIKEEDMQPKPALSNWLIQRAIARAAERAAAEAEASGVIVPLVETPESAQEQPEIAATAPPPVAIEPQPEHVPVPNLEEPTPLAEAQPESVILFEPIAVAPQLEPVPVPTLEEPVVPPGPPPEPVSRFEPVVVDEFLWESLMRDSKVAPDPGFQVIHGSASSQAELVVPAGIHGGDVLAELTQSRRPFSGLVVSIGSSEADGRPSRDERVLADVRTFVSGLLRPADCLCANGDELVLICPNEIGMDAQRRLASLSESLWDYQLQNAGSSSPLLSLGGIDVQREPLDQAVTTATERMLQTKRGRKAVMMPPPGQRRKAV